MIIHVVSFSTASRVSHETLIKWEREGMSSENYVRDGADHGHNIL